MRAIKYRSKWASGPSPWAWKLVPDGTTHAEAADLMIGASQEHEWSDKFRGMDWVLTGKIPKTVLEEKLVAAENMAKVATRRAQEIRVALAKL